MSKINFNCNEANHVCDKNQYREASLWEKIKLNFHLIYCRACRKYSSRNVKLTKLINSKNVHALDEDCKKQLQRTINKELAKQQ